MLLQGAQAQGPTRCCKGCAAGARGDGRARCHMGLSALLTEQQHGAAGHLQSPGSQCPAPEQDQAWQTLPDS